MSGPEMRVNQRGKAHGPRPVGPTDAIAIPKIQTRTQASCLLARRTGVSMTVG